jgi:hypothetical protein
MGTTPKLPEGIDLNISYNKFYGIDNANDPVSLRVGEDGTRLTTGTNIDINLDMTMELRDGYTFTESGIFKNFWASGGVMFGIKNNNFVRYYKESGVLTSEILWYGAGIRKLVYCDTGMGIYISDGVSMKVFRNDVLTDVPETTNPLKIKLPPSTLLEFHKSRMYSIWEKYIFISDCPTQDNPYYDVVDMRTGIKIFPSDIVMFKAIKGGIYVSDSYNTWFMRDIDPIMDVPFSMKMFDIVQVFDYPAVPGGTGRKQFKITTPSGKYYDEAVIWTSIRGICIGGNDGITENLTEKMYNMPSIFECTDFYRKKGNSNQYITLLKTRG